MVNLTTFTCKKLDPKLVGMDTFIGAEFWGGRMTMPMHGDLVALEIYGNKKNAETTELPNSIKQLIIQDQRVTRRNEEAPVKKMKMSWWDSDTCRACSRKLLIQFELKYIRTKEAFLTIITYLFCVFV